MQRPLIGYFGVSIENYPCCACIGDSLIIIQKRTTLKKLLSKHFSHSKHKIEKAYSDEVVKGLKLGGSYHFDPMVMMAFTHACILDYPHLFDRNRELEVTTMDDIDLYKFMWI